MQALIILACVCLAKLNDAAPQLASQEAVPEHHHDAATANDEGFLVSSSRHLPADHPAAVLGQLNHAKPVKAAEPQQNDEAADVFLQSAPEPEPAADVPTPVINVPVAAELELTAPKEHMNDLQLEIERIQTRLMEIKHEKELEKLKKEEAKLIVKWQREYEQLLKRLTRFAERGDAVAATDLIKLRDNGLEAFIELKRTQTAEARLADQRKELFRDAAKGDPVAQDAVAALIKEDTGAAPAAAPAEALLGSPDAILTPVLANDVPVETLSVEERGAELAAILERNARKPRTDLLSALRRALESVFGGGGGLLGGAGGARGAGGGLFSAVSQALSPVLSSLDSKPNPAVQDATPVHESAIRRKQPSVLGGVSPAAAWPAPQAAPLPATIVQQAAPQQKRGGLFGGAGGGPASGIASLLTKGLIGRLGQRRAQQQQLNDFGQAPALLAGPGGVVADELPNRGPLVDIPNPNAAANPFQSAGSLLGSAGGFNPSAGSLLGSAGGFNPAAGNPITPAVQTASGLIRSLLPNTGQTIADTRIEEASTGGLPNAEQRQAERYERLVQTEQRARENRLASFAQRKRQGESRISLLRRQTPVNEQRLQAELRKYTVLLEQEERYIQNSNRKLQSHASRFNQKLILPPPLNKNPFETPKPEERPVATVLNPTEGRTVVRPTGNEVGNDLSDLIGRRIASQEVGRRINEEVFVNDEGSTLFAELPKAQQALLNKIERERQLIAKLEAQFVQSEQERRNKYSRKLDDERQEVSLILRDSSSPAVVASVNRELERLERDQAREEKLAGKRLTAFKRRIDSHNRKIETLERQLRTKFSSEPAVIRNPARSGLSKDTIEGVNKILNPELAKVEAEKEKEINTVVKSANKEILKAEKLAAREADRLLRAQEREEKAAAREAAKLQREAAKLQGQATRETGGLFNQLGQRGQETVRSSPFGSVTTVQRSGPGLDLIKGILGGIL